MKMSGARRIEVWRGEMLVYERPQSRMDQAPAFAEIHPSM
jgi:hypothetical protein